MMSFEQQVRERAYHIWIAAGMGHGMAHEHWVSAEQALLSEHARPAEAAKVKTSKAKSDAAAPKKASRKKAPVAPPAIAAKAAKPKANAADARVGAMGAN